MSVSLCAGTVFFYAAAASFVSGICYIIILETSKILPVVITSPLGTGVTMGLTTLLSVLLYRENLRSQERKGLILSILGVMLILLPQQ